MSEPSQSSELPKDLPADSPAPVAPDAPTAAQPSVPPSPAPPPPSSTEPPATFTPPPPPDRSFPPPPPVAEAASEFASASPGFAERPEIAVGAAFAGGLVLALILKRLAR